MPNTDRILVVEDDRDALETLFMLLSREGYSVLTANNGQQGLDLLVHGIQPRLLVIDLLLPKVPGWDILKHAQSDPSLRQMPVVVVTALSPEDVNVRADAVFYKPIDYPALLTTVRRLMSSPKVT
jgi:CheY-like chemotaxis protein